MRKGRIFMAVAAAALSALWGVSALALTLVPGGQSIGVAVSTGGLLVTGAADVGNVPSPGRLAGIAPGDVIVSIDGQEITDVNTLPEMLTGDACRVKYSRSGLEKEVMLTPAYDDAAGAYRLGLWVRQGTAGIGTLTYYNPESGDYGALGHAITDEDTGIVLPVEDGAIYENSIINVEKGREGRPGEIMGQFYDGGYMGDVDKNTVFGVFGRLNAPPDEVMFSQGLEAAEGGEMRTGSASILTTVDEKGLREFDCEIVRIHGGDESPDKSFTIKVTDDELLDITGGIVQGMSGSPIIQNGKLIGAVTHVLVNDPTRGYGIFIENMLEAAS